MTQYTFQADINAFNSNTQLYLGSNAFFLADCAKLAYQPKASIRQIIVEQLGFTHFKFFSGASTQAYIAGNDNMVIVAFRGTEMKLEDLKSDAKLRLENGPKGEVHRGFQDALHETWGAAAGDNDMRLAIKEFRDQNQSLWFCGHSLGAALTTLAAAEYVLLDGEPAENIHGIYTIGQPRVGNDIFAEAFNAELGLRCYRFVNNNDIVPRVPLPGLLFKYSHVGQRLYINSKGILQPVIPIWKRVWDMWRGVEEEIGKRGVDALEDHGSEHYVRLIGKNQNVVTPWS